jgi:hypothetical protein
MSSTGSVFRHYARNRSPAVVLDREVTYYGLSPGPTVARFQGYRHMPHHRLVNPLVTLLAVLCGATFSINAAASQYGGNTYYCSTDGKAYAEAQGGILCPVARGSVPVCPNGHPCVCIDGDGSCTDGDDDWGYRPNPPTRPTQAYPQAPGFGQPGYQAAPVYGQPPAYQPPPVYGQPAYQPAPVYGQPAYQPAPVYGQPPVYQPAPVYGQPQPYPQTLSGHWTSQYQCPTGHVYPLVLRIDQQGQKITAVKTTDDACLAAGVVAFNGTLNGNSGRLNCGEVYDPNQIDPNDSDSVGQAILRGVLEGLAEQGNNTQGRGFAVRYGPGTLRVINTNTIEACTLRFVRSGPPPAVYGQPPVYQPSGVYR